MVKITRQPPISPAATPAKQPIKVAPSEKTKNEPQEATPGKRRFERRKNKDRRKRNADRGPYDSRAGRDRRKNSPSDGSIDIDV